LDTGTSAKSFVKGVEILEERDLNEKGNLLAISSACLRI
jgi:hypothetical protein